MGSSRTLVTALALTLHAACATPPDSPESPQTSKHQGSPAVNVAAFVDQQIFEPQLVGGNDGTLLMIWRQKGGSGFDLFSARLLEHGGFSEPSRINDEAGTVYSYPHDEMRSSVAKAPDGRLAVTWSDERSQIRAAVSDSHGEAWSVSIRLDQGDEPAYRGFPASGFDSDGTLNAVWIDSRHAPNAGAEEPADLFYARVRPEASGWGPVEEINLTADQEASVCGCCKPDLEVVSDGRLRAVFRNTDGDGYRDIFTITGDPDGGFGRPVRVGPPTWQIQGCPMSGPLGLESSGVENGVMFREASSGQWRLTEGEPGGEKLTDLYPEGVGDWKMTLSPRGVEASSGMVLVPGQPTGRVIERNRGVWETVRDDIPAWATSAATVESGLLVVGAVDGKLEAAVLEASTSR